MKKLLLSLALMSATLTGCTHHSEPQSTVVEAEVVNKDKLVAELQQIDKSRVLDPYKVGLRSRQQVIISQLTNYYLADADRAVEKNDYVTATQMWRSVLDYQSGNQRALQGLKKIDASRALNKLYDRAIALRDIAPEKALEKVQLILEESPNWPQAVALRDHLLREIAVQNQPEMKMNRELKKPVQLNFSKHNLMGIFEAVSKITGINIIYDKDVPVSAVASLTARNISAENALNLLLISNQLRKKILNENTLLIYPATSQKEKLYRDTVVKTVFLGYAKAKELNVALRNLIKLRDIHIDERTNSITFRGTKENVEKAERMLITLDRPEAEVTLAVEVLEVNTKDVEKLGVNYPGQIGVGFNAGKENQHNISINGLTKENMFLNLGAAQGISADLQQVRANARVLANPRIRVKNNKKAQIDIGERIPVLTSTVSDGFSQEKVEYQDVGLKLEVTPDISLDGGISMDVKFNLSTIGSAERSKDGVAYYRTNNREATTVLSSLNGETQMLAGLIKDSESQGKSGLPWLSQLPLVGNFFGSHESSHERTEVILLITPSIERNIDLPGAHINTIEMGPEEAQGESSYMPPSGEKHDSSESFTPPSLAPPAQFPEQTALPAPIGSEQLAAMQGR